MTTPDAASVQGTFEYIEAKIRRDAKGTAFGGDFEWLCQWFLENAPRYRGQFDKVWLWKDWPDRWGTDAGIDIVARTRTGELWAIQAKADHPNRAITKREIDSFLSESNRPQFAYRLLMATTDAIGATARRTLHGQEKLVGPVRRGHFLIEEVRWPVQIGRIAARLPRWNARPHQATEFDAAIHGFRNHDRGQLNMWYQHGLRHRQNSHSTVDRRAVARLWPVFRSIRRRWTAGLPWISEHAERKRERRRGAWCLSTSGPSLVVTAMTDEDIVRL